MVNTATWRCNKVSRKPIALPCATTQAEQQKHVSALGQGTYLRLIYDVSPDHGRCVQAQKSHNGFLRDVLCTAVGNNITRHTAAKSITASSSAPDFKP